MKDEQKLERSEYQLKLQVNSSTGIQLLLAAVQPMSTVTAQ